MLGEVHWHEAELLLQCEACVRCGFPLQPSKVQVGLQMYMLQASGPAVYKRAQA